MNKSELIDAVAEKSEVSRKQASVILDAFVNTVTGALSDGDQIVLPGFGTFSVGLRSARKGRNPKTGETIEIKHTINNRKVFAEGALKIAKWFYQKPKKLYYMQTFVEELNGKK